MTLNFKLKPASTPKKLLCLHPKKQSFTAAWIQQIDNQHAMLKQLFQSKQPLCQPSLLSLFKNTNHKNWPVNLILPATDYQIRLIELPDVDQQDLIDAVKLKASDFIDFPIEQAIVELIDIPEQAFHGRRRMGYLVISNLQRIEHYHTQLQLAGLSLHCIDIEDMGLRNLALFNHNHNRCGLLAITEQQTQITLCFEQQLVLTRKIDIGLSSLIQDNQLNEIQKEALILEIQRSFDYFQSQLGLGLVAQLNMVVDHPNNQILMDFLQKNVNCHSQLLALEPQISCCEPITEQQKQAHLMTIAAGLRYVEQLQ